MITKTPQTYTHAIVYVGAPYGDNERGHVVSRHRSHDLARLAFDRKYGGRTGSLNHKIVELDKSGDWTR